MANGYIPTSRLTPTWLMESLTSGLHREPMERSQFFPGFQQGGDEAYESYAKAVRLGYNPSQEFLAKLHKQRGPGWADDEGQEWRNMVKSEWDDYTSHIQGGGEAGTFETQFTNKDWISSSTYGSPVVGNVFDPMSFAEAQFGQQKDWEGRIPPMEAFPTPKVSDFKKLTTGHYQPEIQEKRGSLIDQLVSKRATAGDVGKGIAGYGVRDLARDTATEGYRTGVEGIYADVGTKRATAMQDLLDSLSAYDVLGEVA